ncbi:MAG: sulfite exporter TauE/SafE family protein [Brevundimonas sp.]|uniref:sulfite exporter TauE/SafE family protein n=1 Tax=Brevundimonas sp. TaxID=1871086 RepID=UPI003919B12D
MLMVAFLLVGAFFAAAISGAAGFGGALLLLPLLTRTVGIEQAVPMLTVAQIIGNLSRVGLGWRVIEWRPAALFLGAAIPAAGLGALVFAELPTALIVRFVGIAILLFVGLRLTGVLKFRASPPVLIIGGAGVGFLSGVVGSAGPLGAAIFLSLGLPPVAYIATEAVTAVGIHLTKIAIYQQQLSLGRAFWPLALGMGAAMFAGTWAAKRVVEKMPKVLFERVVSFLLIAVAVQMIIWP